MRLMTQEERDASNMRVIAVAIGIILLCGYKLYEFLAPYGWTAFWTILGTCAAVLVYAVISEQARLRKLRNGE